MSVISDFYKSLKSVAEEMNKEEGKNKWKMKLLQKKSVAKVLVDGLFSCFKWKKLSYRTTN